MFFIFAFILPTPPYVYCSVANDHGGYVFMSALVIDKRSVVVRLIQFGVVERRWQQGMVVSWCWWVIRNNGLAGGMIWGVQSEQHKNDFGRKQGQRNGHKTPTGRASTLMDMVCWGRLAGCFKPMQVTVYRQFGRRSTKASPKYLEFRSSLLLEYPSSDSQTS